MLLKIIKYKEDNSFQPRKKNRRIKESKNQVKRRKIRERERTKESKTKGIK